jgi:hypothetical protein
LSAMRYATLRACSWDIGMSGVTLLPSQFVPL